MRYLKIITVTFLVVIGLFLLVGFLFPTIEYGHEIIVDKGIEESWAVSQDTTKMHLWLQGFQSITLIDGIDGQVGSQYKVVVNPGEGQDDFVMHETVLDRQPPSLIHLKFDSEMMLFDQVLYLKQKGDKTVVGTQSKVAGKSIFMRSMFALMHYIAGSFQQQEVKNIEALKNVINSNSSIYPANNSSS